MAIITAGYDGTVDEVQFAKLLHRYSVAGAGDFKASTIAGDRIVSIANGTALGPGTVDVATDIPPIQFEAATGTRWDMVVLRRDWQPPGGLSEIKIIKGGTSDTLPAVGTAATAWNRRPGIMDDQPLYLQEINGTLLGNRIDLRCWQSNGGLVANHDRVRSYLDTPGTRVQINGVDWLRRVGANDTAEWVNTQGVSKRLHAEFTGLPDGGASLGGAAWQFAPLSLDGNNTFNNTFVTASASKSRLLFTEAGCYSVTVKYGTANAPGHVYASIKNSANTVYYADAHSGSGEDWGCTVSIPNLLITSPNTEILFGLRTGVTVGGAGRITVQKISD